MRIWIAFKHFLRNIFTEITEVLWSPYTPNIFINITQLHSKDWYYLGYLVRAMTLKKTDKSPWLHSIHMLRGDKKKERMLSLEYLWQNCSMMIFQDLTSVQFSHSVVSDSLQHMNRSMPGLPVHHQLLEFTQTHVPWVGDAIQPTHPLSSPSSPAPNSSQHQSLFQWVNSSHEVAKVLKFQLQHQSFQWTPRTDLL